MEDKVVMVTGAASGLGKACAERFVADGASVVLADREDLAEVAAAVETSGGRALAVRVDVSDERSVEDLFAAAVRRFGRLDALAHLAGVSGRSPVTELTVADWDRIVDVNLKGTFLVCRAAIRLMREAGGGAIVTTGSELAFAVTPNIGVYSASKAGVVHLTRCLAREHGADGIRVNCICPGPIDTPMLARGMAVAPDPMERRRQIEASTALGRIGRAEEIANVVRFLLSDEASYMTGAAVLVDGGVTVKSS